MIVWFSVVFAPSRFAAWEELRCGAMWTPMCMFWKFVTLFWVYCGVCFTVFGDCSIEIGPPEN